MTNHPHSRQLFKYFLFRMTQCLTDTSAAVDVYHNRDAAPSLFSFACSWFSFIFDCDRQSVYLLCLLLKEYDENRKKFCNSDPLLYISRERESEREKERRGSVIIVYMTHVGWKSFDNFLAKTFPSKKSSFFRGIWQLHEVISSII